MDYEETDSRGWWFCTEYESSFLESWLSLEYPSFEKEGRHGEGASGGAGMPHAAAAGVTRSQSPNLTESDSLSLAFIA
ncbi:hypothetical protein K0M31_006046 [Melipona bicolor]|uniref:Uncharacterized protein n=1 Tax=Melipona bicolor TaxID=60889 RepID=A0AA40KLI8_9HYME|nr:hypothetical protein K0M31_006046 [Melipona bicolor]